MSEGVQLAIESSAGRASVALAEGGELVFSSEVEAGGRQSEVLMGPLRAALERANGAEIELVVVGTGPGSYNGARVGIAAGQGVGIVNGCPVVGICSLEGVAAVRESGRCLALGDARRGSFFTLELCRGHLSGEPELMTHPEFVDRVAGGLERGDRLLSVEDPSRLRLPGKLERRVELVAPVASLLLEAWGAKGGEERAALRAVAPEPFYLRPPHITEAGKRGRDSGVGKG